MALVAVNLVFGALLLASPGNAQEDNQPAGGGGVYDCCKASTSGQTYCCDNCCWSPTTPTCKASSECR